MSVVRLNVGAPEKYFMNLSDNLSIYLSIYLSIKYFFSSVCLGAEYFEEDVSWPIV